MSSLPGEGGPEGEDPILLLLVTAPEEEAAALARKLVEERLAACGNVIPGIRSIYRWEGKVEEDGEALVILKAPRSRRGALLSRIPQLHSYDVPEILVLEVVEGHRPYLEWVREETRTRTGGGE